tara:strand:- start:488 stop:850 length:363 start_codon:yes stop_codon:yes gene_type:complete
MLALLQNNFVISGLVSLILTIFIVSQDRNREEKHGMLFYLRCFALNFVLVLVVLYFKTGDLSLPSVNQSGGSLPINPTSSTSSVSLPVTTSVQSGGVNLNSADPGSELGLHRVNLGNTPF